jgi:phosphatidate cytidylyltransferase
LKDILMNCTALLPRAATGLALIALLALALARGGLWLYGLAFAFGAPALWEFYALVRLRIRCRIAGIVLCLGLFATTGCGLAAVPIFLCAGMLVPAAGFLLAYGRGDDNARMDGPALVMAGILYVALPVALLLTLDRLEQIFLILIPAVADTFAYFTGVSLGRHRVWPRVSPKKSLEGCGGALAGCMGLCVIFGCLWGTKWPDFWFLYPGLGLVLAVAAVAGDFFESALKRTRQAKDSGCLLPGHGGVLDRVDSFLFVVPAYMALRALIPLF